MGCGSAGQQLANVLPVCLVNAARIHHNVVLDEFNIAVDCSFDDVVLSDDARRSLRLRVRWGKARLRLLLLLFPGALSRRQKLQQPLCLQKGAIFNCHSVRKW